jgi:hypothetical protein
MKCKFLFLTMLFFCQISLANADDSHVGDIRYSILSKDQFIRLHGGDWDLLRGQAVPVDSELREYWGDRNLPNANGVFLRSANHDQEASIGNPDGNVGIGHYQKDQFASHSHRHGKMKAGDNKFQSRGGNAHWLGEFEEVESSQAGGIETRPRNITVNTFVKIRESAPALNRPEISTELVTQLFRSTEFLGSLREAITATFRSMI